MPEQATQQEEQAESIVQSAEAFAKHLSTNGEFSYLEPNKGDTEDTVTFTNAMEDCDIKPEFIKAVFELYKEVKRPMDEFKSGELGIKVTDLINEIDGIVESTAVFYSHLEHGVDL